MAIVALVVFLVTNLIPGSPAAVILGEDATPEEVQALTHLMGFDRPVWVRLWDWVSDVLRGDMGNSIYTGKAVMPILLTRLEPTLILTVGTVMVAILIGIPLGIVAAVNFRKAADLAAVSLSLVGVSVPYFWLGLNMILVFSYVLRWFPVCGYTRLVESIPEAMTYLFLPILTMGIHHSGGIARMTRASMLEVLRADHIRTARSKGVSEYAVVFKHALRTAILPIASTIGIVIILTVGGSPVIETVFALPGIGRLTIESVLRRDFPMIQGCILLIAASVAMVNLLVDLAYASLDPRIVYH